MPFQWLLLLLSFVCVAREGSSCGCPGKLSLLAQHPYCHGEPGLWRISWATHFCTQQWFIEHLLHAYPFLASISPPPTHTHMISGLRKSCLVRGQTLDEEIHISYMIVHCGTWNKAQDLDPMKEKTHFLRVWNYI